MAKGNEKTDAIVMTTSIDLLEQVRMSHQQFHLFAQNLHKLLPGLPVSQCKHLSGSYVLALLGSLPRAGVNPHGLLPNAIWQMAVTHHVSFGNLRYAHAMTDACSGFTYALALPGKKETNAIKALKSAILIMEVPWARKADNGLPSLQFNNFEGSWKIIQTTDIPYNPHG